MRLRGKFGALPTFVRHVAEASIAAAGQRWLHYSVLRSIEGKGFYVNPTVLLHRDAESRMVFGAGVHVGAHSYACALDGSKLELEDGVYLNEFNNLRAAGGGDIFIGARTIVAQFVSIIGSNHRIPPRGESIRDAGNEPSRTGVRIGREVWIGANVVILPGVEIGDGAVIGAGSVVSRSIAAFAIAAGNPARVLKHRPEE